jgi:hypothetical protein
MLVRSDEFSEKWASHAEIFQMTYGFSGNAQHQPGFQEIVEVGIESLNRLGLVKLTPGSMDMGPYKPNCPLDLDYLKYKHRNPIEFHIFKAQSNPSPICFSESTSVLYEERLLSIAGTNENPTLIPFGRISCDINRPMFQKFGPGIIVHEIFHLLGILHTHQVNDTRGILNVDIPKPNFYSIVGKLSKYLDIYNYLNGSFVPNSDKYDPASPLDVMHYLEEKLIPYKSLNKSTLNRILKDDYHFSTSLIQDYFYLLKGSGPRVLTYHDIFSLAVVIMKINPENLVGKHLWMPDYLLIDGIYAELGYLEKLERILSEIKKAENFTYPILMKQSIEVSVVANDHFIKNLIKESHAVSLNGPIRCAWHPDKVNEHNIHLSENCHLLGMIENPGIIQLEISLRNEINSTKNLRIDLSVQMQTYRILLGKKEIKHPVEPGISLINLVNACQAVALPNNEIDCRLKQPVHDKELALNRCWLRVNLEKERSMNLSVVLSNHDAEKICNLFITMNRTNMTSSPNKTNQLYNLRKIQGSLLQNEFDYRITNDFLLTQNASFAPSSSFNWLQLSYLVIIPFFKGSFNTFVTKSNLFNSFSKFILQYSLTMLSIYCIYTRFPIWTSLGIGMASVLNTVIRSKSKNSLWPMLLDLMIVELEYGSSNVWEISGKPDFFPDLFDQLNLYFAQCFFVPAMHSLGSIVTNLAYNDNQEIGHTPNHAKTHETSFRTSINTAINTVFSEKIFRLFHFFRPQLKISETEKLAVNQSSLS